MKLTKPILRELINEALEDLYVMDRAQNVTRLSRDSVDDQVDSLILKFEREAIPEEDNTPIDEAMHQFSLLSLINEQVPNSDVEEENLELAVEDEEEEIDDPGGSEEVSVNEPAEKTKKAKLDVDIFAQRIARLAMSHDALLDVPTVIVNRAVTFLEKNYNQEHVDTMIDILNNQFDFNLGKERNEHERAAAVGAFGGGEGGSAPTGS